MQSRQFPFKFKSVKFQRQQRSFALQTCRRRGFRQQIDGFRHVAHSRIFCGIFTAPLKIDGRFDDISVTFKHPRPFAGRIHFNLSEHVVSHDFSLRNNCRIYQFFLTVLHVKNKRTPVKIMSRSNLRRHRQFVLFHPALPDKRKSLPEHSRTAQHKKKTEYFFHFSFLRN